MICTPTTTTIIAVEPSTTSTSTTTTTTRDWFKPQGPAADARHRGLSDRCGPASRMQVCAPPPASLLTAARPPVPPGEHGHHLHTLPQGPKNCADVSSDKRPMLSVVFVTFWLHNEGPLRHSASLSATHWPQIAKSACKENSPSSTAQLISEPVPHAVPCD